MTFKQDWLHRKPVLCCMAGCCDSIPVNSCEALIKGSIISIDSYKNNLSLITYDPLEVCGGVCVFTDPALCLYFTLFTRFLGINTWATTFAKALHKSQNPRLRVGVFSSSAQ